MQWHCNDAKIPNKLSVKIGKSQKPLQLLAVPGDWPTLDRTHLLGVHGYLPLCHNISQKGHPRLVEVPLLRLHEELVVEEALENLMDMLYVGLNIQRENQDVVEVIKRKHIEHIL